MYNILGSLIYIKKSSSKSSCLLLQPAFWQEKKTNIVGALHE